KLSTLLIIGFLVICVFTVRKIKLSNDMIFFLPIFLYFLISCSLIYSSDSQLRYLTQRFSLIIFPFLFMNTDLNSENKNRILLSFVWGNFVALLICYCVAIKKSFLFLDGTLRFQPVINSEQSFLYSVVRDGNYFFSQWFSQFHDTIYFALY